MSSARRSLRLLGYGRFGEALAGLALDAGWELRAHDPAAEVPAELRAADPASLLEGEGLVLLAVPMASFRATLESIRPRLHTGHIVLDVCSVKHDAVRSMAEVCGEDIPWVATHPLFGPTSIALGENPLRVVVCGDTPHASAAQRVRAFYEELGCLVAEQPSDEHDRAMASTHALAFFVAKGMLELGAGEGELVPPSFRAMAATIESVRADAGHLFVPIQNANPHAAAARERLLETLAEIHRELAAQAGGPLTSTAASLSIAPAPRTADDIGAARDGIDALDEELVELLSRRTQLALRAARAKERAGRPLQDPAREEQLLAQRRAAAARRSLDTDRVAEVFEAILRLSRAEQRRWLDERGAGGGEG